MRIAIGFEVKKADLVDDEEQKEIEAILAQRSDEDREVSHTKTLSIEL